METLQNPLDLPESDNKTAGNTMNDKTSQFRRDQYMVEFAPRFACTVLTIY